MDVFFPTTTCIRRRRIRISALMKSLIKFFDENEVVCVLRDPNLKGSSPENWRPTKKLSKVYGEVETGVFGWGKVWPSKWNSQFFAQKLGYDEIGLCGGA